jgi:Domain of unknown function (DUF5666)
MRSSKSARAAALLVLPVLAIIAPSSAAARANTARHHSHHAASGAHRAHTVSFYARVVRSSTKGLIVRKSDGKILTFSSKQIKRTVLSKRHGRRGGRVHHLGRAGDLQISSGNVVVNILGLQPGVLVQITETVGDDGTVTITITLPASSGQQSTSGVVTEVGTDAFTLQAADGSNLRLHMAQDALSNLNLQTCETVNVSFHQNAGILIADNVTSTGASSSGDCAPTSDATGQITQVSSGSVTIAGDQGAMTFSVDPSSGLTDGFQVGDLVDVTYTQNSDGTLRATDVQFVEEDATGKVTSVTTTTNGGSLTIADDNTGQSDTFIADPNNGVQINARAFTGVSVGDQVDVTYHQSAGKQVADTVTEQ